MTTQAFTPSKYQQAIFDFIQTGKGNAVVEAVAGSGKTTTILQALKFIPANQSVTFLAFNKDIADKLKRDIAELGVTNADARTLNSLGLRAWTKFKGVNKCNVEGKKLDLIGRTHRDFLQARYHQSVDSAHQEEFVYVRTHLMGIIGLARKAKVNGIAPTGVPGVQGLVADTVENWEAIIDHYGIEFVEGSHTNDGIAIRAAQAILKKSVLDHDTIDFDDMFYLPLLYNATFPKSDWIFIDEAQDVSDIQRELLARAMGPKTRLVAVGDPCQSIYGFRGANPESLNNITRDFNATTLPLSISYRCSKAVVEYAQGIVSHILPNENAPQGSVTDLKDKFSLKGFRQDDMILCRNNAPLVNLAYDLIGEKIPCLLKGRDIGQGLIKLIDKLEASTVKGLLTKLDAWEHNETARMLKKDADADLTPVQDKADSIRVFAKGSSAKTVAALKAEITAMFKLSPNAWENENRPDEGRADILTLSSIHKAKGLEAPRVFILNYSLMPSKYAKKPWQVTQETNLQYVAVTRAKKDLVFIDRDANTRGERVETVDSLFDEVKNANLKTLSAQTGGI